MTLHEFCLHNQIGEVLEEEIAMHLDIQEGRHDDLPEQTYIHAYVFVVQSRTSNWLK